MTGLSRLRLRITAIPLAFGSGQAGMGAALTGGSEATPMVNVTTSNNRYYREMASAFAAATPGARDIDALLEAERRPTIKMRAVAVAPAMAVPQPTERRR